MGQYGYLRIGLVNVAQFRNGVEDEVLALFRDDMQSARHVMASEYYKEANGYEEIAGEEDYEVDTTVYRASGRVILERLELMGATEGKAITFLQEQFKKREPNELLDQVDIENRQIILDSVPQEERAAMEYRIELTDSLTADRWIEMLAAASADPAVGSSEVGGLCWLLDSFLNRHYWGYLEERLLMRAILLVLPEAEVVFDVTDLVGAGYLGSLEPNSLASRAVAKVRSSAAINAPVIVLTEGRTDVEFLSAGLQILYPHLEDLIRFLDYENKPDGGVGALVRMVRSFTAAGVSNRVVAVFDNDTAAADALRTLDLEKLPDRVRAIQYPPIEIAKSYPTLGPPTVEHPEGSLSYSDVNGLAGSIELYLGSDVLAQSEGGPWPVQWKSYIPAMRRYQGEVVEKELIHKEYRQKYREALADPSVVQHQDWSGMHLILEAIRAAAI